MDDETVLLERFVASPTTAESDEEHSRFRRAVGPKQESAAPPSENPGAPLEQDGPAQASLCPWDTIESLYARHADNLRGYLRKLVGAGPPDPDDVVQAAFEKLANVKNPGQIKSPHAFLWRTAQNIVSSEFRSASVRERHAGNVTDVFYSEKSDSLDPERVLLATKELSAVMSAVESMPPARRTVLLMSRVEGLSLTEISERLGISRSAVYKRLSVAMTELHTAANKA